jgi:hypothetical protein
MATYNASRAMQLVRRFLADPGVYQRGQHDEMRTIESATPPDVNGENQGDRIA